MTVVLKLVESAMIAIKHGFDGLLRLQNAALLSMSRSTSEVY